MSKVITFSRVFPFYHPRAGEPTHFIEKVWESLLSMGLEYPLQHIPGEYDPKHHTIRAGHRWKAGDWFSPRVWSDKPYRSKQIQFAPDIQIKKVWDFDIAGEDGKFFVDQSPFTSRGMFLSELAKNDGLTGADFKAWFKHPKAFEGQIISWSDKIQY